MYEVFLKERKVIITSPGSYQFINKMGTVVHADSLHSVDNSGTDIAHFLEGEDPLLVISGDENLLWEKFKSTFTLLPAAGGIVHSTSGYLFIYRKLKWDLPKGKIDHDESAEEAALREVKEETGLKQLTVTGIYPSTWHIYRTFHNHQEGEWILKETKWFSMEGLAEEQLVPESSEEIEAAGWFSPGELDKVLSNTYASLQTLITSLQQ
jgi:8-oxo-dGTP pyrophosphatase MutT (NUDIX family)